MAFVQSSKEIRLEGNHVLIASVRDASGNWKESRLDLDRHVGNTDGWFLWEGENFSHSAKNVLLEGTRLTADLPKRDGGYRERQGIELNDRIGNDDGNLTFK